MNTPPLLVNSVCVPETDKLLAASETLKLRIMEIEVAQKAKREAEQYLRLLVAESLNKSALKPVEGELVKVQNYDFMYFYSNGEWQSFPLLEDL